MTKDLIKAQQSAPTHQQSINDGVGFSRRQFFQLAGTGLTGFFFTQVARPLEVLAQSPSVPLINTAKYVIYIHLDGGPSHADTFDLKEGAWTPRELEPTTYGEIRWPRGLMPKLADQLPNIALVRSMSAWALVHQLAQIWNEIGRNPANAMAKVAPNIGAVAALEFDARRTPEQRLPGFIALNAGTITGTGYLSSRFAPFIVAPNPNGLANTAHPEGEARFQRRYDMLSALEANNRNKAPFGQATTALTSAYDQARGLMYNPEVQAVFRYSQEEAMRYGNTGFGVACLLARNIVKSDLGTRFIQINQGGWDNHSNVYNAIRGPITQFDNGLSQLLIDLANTPSKSGGRLLDETLIVAMGEFGRTTGPLNNQQGRDHYLQMSALFAGARVRGGRAIGKTDAVGARTEVSGWSRGVDMRPEDVFCTIYSALGIDYTTVRTDDPFKRGFEYVPFAKEGLYAPIDTLW